MLRTLRYWCKNSRTLTGWQKDSLRKTDGYSRHDLSILCMFPEEREKEEKEESHWELSFLMALKQTFTVAPVRATRPWKGRQQVLSSFWDSTLPHASSRRRPPSRALHQMQVFSKQLPSGQGPSGCVAATAVAAALVVLPAGEGLAVALGAWVLACPGAVSACKLWLYPKAVQWWSWGKGPTQVPKAGPYPVARRDLEYLLPVCTVRNRRHLICRVQGTQVLVHLG